MTTTDEQVLADRLDLEMLERPHLWPQQRLGMRCVFLKRGLASGPFGANHTGPCFQTDEGSYVVMEHDWNADGKVTPRHYDSAQDVCDDGWRVD